ncbi:YqgE/AlgH family protein [Phenylobacterium sp.]|uniref:YqgE/AlgH family protein n=1 Tax=Phenylobacterium sp. TaxID=1871053 RepID=UPI0025E32DBE|nr:YqgE/AlgH family protein [Phenylobacterium sp.]MBX3485802.1 YqgE/AlgH family protein [Phenylobacterium sp.]MCW5761027.1 YqgE/AlgH family protein [Phenylobacterium sp.]
MEGAFLNGQMLIAMPGIGDPRFERSLILICAHDAGHAMGIAVNRPVEGLTVPDLLERLEIGATAEMEDDPVLMGGPVEVGRGFVLHTDDYRAEHSLDVEGGLALTATREVLEAMGGRGRRPRRSILALGYAGWGAGQLENELRHNVWLTCEADEELVFGDDHATKWARALAKLRIDPKFLSAEGGRA